MQVMIVSNLDDASLEACLSEIESAGADPVRVADVYTATARLASQDPIHHVVVDIRSLDQHEMQFLKLAGRYFPSLEVFVPNLEGTTRRIASSGENITSTPIRAIAQAIGHGVTSQVSLAQARTGPAAPGVSDSPAPGGAFEPETPGSNRLATPLSTDGGADDADDGPALHEVVRMRMAAGQTAPIRRAPPRHTPEPASASAEVPQSRTESADASVTTEEVNALLGGDDAASHATDDGTSRGGQP